MLNLKKAVLTVASLAAISQKSGVAVGQQATDCNKRFDVICSDTDTRCPKEPGTFLWLTAFCVWDNNQQQYGGYRYLDEETADEKKIWCTNECQDREISEQKRINARQDREIMKNRGDIKINGQAIKENKQDISDNRQGVEKNKRRTDENAEDIAVNSQKVKSNEVDIGTNRLETKENRDGLYTINSTLRALIDDFEKLRDYTGIANTVKMTTELFKIFSLAYPYMLAILGGAGTVFVALRTRACGDHKRRPNLSRESASANAAEQRQQQRMAARR